MAGLDERATELFARIWPDGVPVADRLLFDALPDDQRGRVLDRLDAVDRAERGELLAPLAEQAGLKRAGFFNLRNAWRAHSLAGLVPHETRAGRRLGFADETLRARAADLLRDAPPGARNVELAHQLLASADSSAGDVPPRDRNAWLTRLQQAERIVQHERRALALDPTFLARAYGDAIMVDFTAVGIVLGPADRTLAACAIVLESASTLVLGTALGRPEQGVAIQIAALKDALRWIREAGGDRPAAGRRCDLAVTLPPGLVADADLTRTLGGLVRDLDVSPAGGHAFGQRTVQILGPRVGRMPLFPRRILEPDMDEVTRTRTFPELSVEDATALWTREVARHNKSPLSALAEAGLAGDDLGGAPGRMTAALEAALAFLIAAGQSEG